METGTLHFRFILEKQSKEYPPALKERQKCIETERNLPTGDIILIARAKAPRNPWMIGKVIKTFPYKSGIARSVHTQTSTYLQILLRPVTKVFAQHVNKNSLSYQRIYSQYVHILPFSGQG